MQEIGAQSKAQAEMLAAQVLVFINDPLANETVRAQLANLQQYVDMCKQTAASMAQGSMTALSMQAAKAKVHASNPALAPPARSRGTPSPAHAPRRSVPKPLAPLRAWCVHACAEPGIRCRVGVCD
ncbi:hypothetical protein EON66_10285, partial [archaeon]